MRRLQREDARCYAVTDMRFQHWSSPCSVSPLCNSRWLTRCMWSQRGTLHTQKTIITDRAYRKKQDKSMNQDESSTNFVISYDNLFAVVMSSSNRKSFQEKQQRLLRRQRLPTLPFFLLWSQGVSILCGGVFPICQCVAMTVAPTPRPTSIFGTTNFSEFQRSAVWGAS